MSRISQTLPEKSGVSKLKWTAGHPVGLVPVEQIIVDLKNLDAQNVLSEKL